MKIVVKAENKGFQQMPQYETEGAAGMDLRADVVVPITLKPFERKLIPTGLHIELPKDCVALVCPRSGLALKKGVTVLNAPGIVDSDYRGDIGVILINLSNEDFIVGPGDRIAQLVITHYMQAEWTSGQPLDETERGEGGFGHTGVF